MNVKPTFSSYMEVAAGFKGLTKEDKIRLALKAKNGCEKSLVKLISSCLYLVPKIAASAHETIKDKHEQDICQEGVVGLLKAFNAYDEKKGVKFDTFAYFHVLRAIYEYIGKRTKFFPFSLRPLFFALSNDESKKQTDEELSHRFGCPVSEVKRTRALKQTRFVALEAAPEPICSEDITNKLELDVVMKAASMTLTEKEFSVIKLRLADVDWKTISETTGLSSPHNCYGRGVTKLKRALRV